MDILKDIGLIYIMIMSIVGFASMGIDKSRAKKKQWRISERTLLLIAFIGGGVGSFLGMRYFRHKTQHKKFSVILPLVCTLYLFIFIFIRNI